MLKQQAVNKVRNLKLIIEENEYFGFYLYVFDLTTGQRTHDHHYFKDQLDDLYHHAQEDYGIYKDMFMDI